MAEEKKEQNNYAGEVNILDEDCNELEIIIDDKKYFAAKNERKKEDRHPDYRIYDGPEKKNDVGAAWQGETKTGKDKLSIKLKDVDDFWITAIMNEKEKGPSMFVFKNPKDKK